MELNGKIALVTGASRGIGRAVALELARAGAEVAVNYSASAESAQEVGRQISAVLERVLFLFKRQAGGSASKCPFPADFSFPAADGL